MTTSLQEITSDLPAIHVDVVEYGKEARHGRLRCAIDENLSYNTSRMESYFFARWDPVLHDAFVVAAAVDSVT